LPALCLIHPADFALLRDFDQSLPASLAPSIEPTVFGALIVALVFRKLAQIAKRMPSFQLLAASRAAGHRVKTHREKLAAADPTWKPIFIALEITSRLPLDKRQLKALSQARQAHRAFTATCVGAFPRISGNLIDHQAYFQA
jgi:hypothetical protein